MSDDDYRIALRPDRIDSELLDDVVVKDVSIVHAEMTDDTSMYVACHFADSDQRLMLWVSATKRRGRRMRLEVFASETPSGPDFVYEDDER